MNKFKFALIGASLLIGATPVITSCNDDDDIDNRVTVVEGMIGDMEESLSHCIKTGLTITDCRHNADGSYTLQLSDGSTMTIGAPAGSTGGGADVQVTENANNVIITVNGTEYVIPKGGAGVQLMYSPRYADGIVNLGNEGAEVSFLTNTPIDLGTTGFDIAEAHAYESRLGSELFRVAGARVEGDMVILNLKGGTCMAGTSYAVSVVADINGSKAISNYFTVAVAGDFEDTSEQIGDFTIKAQYNPEELEKGFCRMTVNGEDLLGQVNFRDFFDVLPEGATFVVGSHAAQPNGKAQEKHGILTESLKADGSFEWSFAPRTDFCDGEQNGFLIKVVANDVTKAKIYVQIDDPLRNPNIDWFPGFGGQFEAEYHSRTEPMPLGVNAVNLAEIFNVDNGKVFMGDGDGESVNPEYDINLIFGGKEFFTAYSRLRVTTPDGKDILENDGNKVVPCEYGQKFVVNGNEGIGWFNRGFNVDYQEGPDQLVWDDTRETFDDRGAIGIDWWWGDPTNNATNIDNERNEMLKYYGIYVDNDGVLHTGENYCGFAMRLAIGMYFDYAYGTKKLSAGDQFGLMFVNRRRQAPEVRQPHKAQFGL